MGPPSPTYPTGDQQTEINNVAFLGKDILCIPGTLTLVISPNVEKLTA